MSYFRQKGRRKENDNRAIADEEVMMRYWYSASPSAKSGYLDLVLFRLIGKETRANW
jgi:hypothetical protein